MNARAQWHRTSITIKMKLKSSKIETLHNRNADNTRWDIVFIRALFVCTQTKSHCDSTCSRCAFCAFFFVSYCHPNSWFIFTNILHFGELSARFKKLHHFVITNNFFQLRFGKYFIAMHISWWFLNLNTFNTWNIQTIRIVISVFSHWKYYQKCHRNVCSENG